MARKLDESLKDIAVMAEAAQRLKTAMFAKAYFEKRYKDAVTRVVNDLGEVGLTLQLVLQNEDPELLIEALRIQLTEPSPKGQGADPGAG